VADTTIPALPAGSAATTQPQGFRARISGSLNYLLVLPTLAGILTFTVWPIVAGAWGSLSLQNQAHQKPVFAGLDNYAALVTDPLFWRVIGNTLIYTLGTVPASIALALFMALLLNRKARGIGWLRSAFFYPTMMPMVSVAAIWLFMYNPQIGLVNGALQALHLGQPNWLGDDTFTLPALMILGIWKQAGYLMIFYLAGLQSLPKDVYEAAELDGAGPIQTLARLTWPLLGGTTLFVATIAIAGAFQTADQIYIMTDGGPNNASNLLLFHTYVTAFRFGDLGTAQALTVVLLLMLLVVTTANLVFGGRGAYYEDST
jgi:sn-glycerol 3-phosphate transport system permease protein